MRKERAVDGQNSALQTPTSLGIRDIARAFGYRFDAMNQPLWAPWRIEYVLGKKQQTGCVFCVGKDAQPDEIEQRLVVWQHERMLVMLNRYPFAAGHLLIIPRVHVSRLDELSDDDHDMLFRVVRASVIRLERAVKCEGTNVGINLGAAAGAGIAEHLHVHVVPRWKGDSNFMPVIADKRVVPQALDDTREHLAPFFADLLLPSSAKDTSDDG